MLKHLVLSVHANVWARVLLDIRFFLSDILPVSIKEAFVRHEKKNTSKTIKIRFLLPNF